MTMKKSRTFSKTEKISILKEASTKGAVLAVTTSTKRELF